VSTTSTGSGFFARGDTTLTAAGRAQAAALAATLAGVRFDQVFSSDLLRCQETARLALPVLAVRLDPRLRELDTGPEADFSNVNPDDPLSATWP
jgi:probable phosphoglycerate mutase